jgi:hypothetical protein
MNKFAATTQKNGPPPFKGGGPFMEYCLEAAQAAFVA